MRGGEGLAIFLFIDQAPRGAVWVFKSIRFTRLRRRYRLPLRELRLFLLVRLQRVIPGFGSTAADGETHKGSQAQDRE